MRFVVVGAAASELRRALGPTSWMVLEELLLRSTGPADACVVRVSVRGLAASLGLAKDTVGRAIRRLRAAGLVTIAQQRTDAGIFDTGTYPKGTKISNRQLAELNIHRDDFHGEWNYTIKPQTD